MSILAQRHHGIVVAGRAGGRSWLPLALVALAVGVGGCSQTTNPPVTEAALTGPLVLNSAPGAAPVAGTAPAVVPAAPVAAVSTTALAPAPVASAPAPSALQPEPMPTTAAAATADEGQFPNINKPPTQPGGTLLAEDARAQIISELEALRSKQAAPGGGGDGAGSPSELSKQASTHGQTAIDQIEACSQDGALENNPDCAPAD